MNLDKIDLNTAFSSLEKDASLLTSSRRLSRHLRISFARHQLEKEVQAWPTPDIIPLSSWMEKLFSDMKYSHGRPYLLRQEQEHCLWEDIIISHNPEKSILGLSCLAKTASSAYEMLIRYNMTLDEVLGNADQEIESFGSWVLSFEDICKNRNFLPGCSLPGYISANIAELSGHIPDKLILGGFLEFDPAIKDLLESIALKGVYLSQLDTQFHRPDSARAVFNDFRSQAGAAAHNALALTISDPQARIGIVVPDLENRKNSIIRIFDHLFHPDTITSPSEPQQRLFNISLGEPLAEKPLVRAGLLFLDLLAADKWTIHDLGAVLFSPFFKGHDTEFAARCALDLAVRTDSQPWREASWIIEQASMPDQKHYCPIIAGIFTQARETLREHHKRSPAQWAKIFSRLLEAGGWPDSRPLNSFEHQTFQAFKNELSRLAGLEMVVQHMTCSQALGKLKTLTFERIFQPETPQAPVQIMGLFETVGLEFDHLWVMNMNSANLPLPAKPNPLLPVDIQKKYKVPGSNPKQELEMAGKLMASLQSSSAHSIFSYALQEDHEEMLPSPLVKNLPCLDITPLPADTFLNLLGTVTGNADLENITDDHGLPLDSGLVSGGTRFFQDQALCPFKGYATHRLKARAPEEPLFAVSAIERGNLVHKALMMLWQEAGSLEELKEMIEDQSLERLLEEIAALVVSQVRHHVLFSDEFKTLEQQRLKSLLAEWIKLELSRPEFEVSALEQSENIQIGKIRIKARLDRVDRLSDGTLAVIDYKTGANIEDIEKLWMDQRIIEPQLPIYAQHKGNHISAVILAQINPKSMAFHGISDHPDVFKGRRVKTPEAVKHNDLKDVTQQWKVSLENLAKEMETGLALVSPLPGNEDKACRYCNLAPLCRINEQNERDYS